MKRNKRYILTKNQIFLSKKRQKNGFLAISQISCKYGDRYAGFELTLDGHFGNVILEGSGNKIPI